MKNRLYLVIPCYNEEKVLPVTAPLFFQELETLIAKGKISADSRILFVDDGSTDHTWDLICRFAADNACYCGIRQSRNRGHQNAVLAGLMEAKDLADITISIDCDVASPTALGSRCLCWYMGFFWTAFEHAAVCSCAGDLAGRNSRCCLGLWFYIWSVFLR